MPDLADLDSSLDQMGARRNDVGDHQVKALGRAWCRIRYPFSDRDGARRTRRGHLDDPEVTAGSVVHVQLEAGLLCVERLGAVHVRDRNHNELELEVHATTSDVTSVRFRR